MASVKVYKDGRLLKTFKKADTLNKWIDKTFNNTNELIFRCPRDYITNTYKVLLNNEPTGYLIKVD